MRSGKVVLVVASCALITLVCLIGGCSDDQPVVPVNPADAQYQQVTAEVNQYLDTAIAQFATGLTMAEQDGLVTDVITNAFSPIDPDSLLSGDGWHVVYTTDLVAGYNSFRVDSIQFRHQGLPQDNLPGADAMAIVHNWTIENPDTTVNYRNSEVRSVFVFSSIDTEDAVINGTRYQAIHAKGGEFKHDFDIQMSFSGVTVSNANNGWETGCPLSGLIEGTVDFTQQAGSSLPTTTSWDFEITIENGEAAFTVTAGPYSRSSTSTLCSL